MPIIGGTAELSRSNIEQIIRTHANEIASRLPSIVRQSRNEEDVRQACAESINRFLVAAHISVRPFHEYGLAGGRIDSKYGAVIIEYKNPHTPDRIDLREDASGTKRAAAQIVTRFDEFERAEQIVKKRIFACGIDGRNLFFVRYRNDRFEIERPQPATPATLERLLRALVSLGATGHSYSPENLVRDFGAESDVAKKAVQALYAAISATSSEKAQTFFEQWKILYGEVCGYDVHRADEKIRKLAAHYGVRAPHAAKLLFALHTYYSIFIKLLASEIVANFAGFASSAVKKCVQSATAAALRREIGDLEQGGRWRSWGINNFLEGDLFAWYVAAWDDEVATAVRQMALAVDAYDPSTLSIDPDESRDLLKKLYQHLFPQSVRHDLGEYYTPDWLADKVLDRVEYDGDPRKRFLDPACGSGTFLISAINRIKRWYDENRDSCGFQEDELARLVLSNVVGFELNPLAVMASRTNYLLAIRELIRLRPEIEIPVYLCDSVATPAEYGALFSLTKRLKTAVGEFVIPAEISHNSHDLARYAEIIERSVENQYGAAEFLQYCADEGLSVAEADVHKALYSKIAKLNSQRKNGIWARIIKNSFAPLFSEPFNVVCGNPPWINWESLPSEYRESLEPVWRRYELFTLSGTAARLGGGKKDMAMLFVYVGADKYLRDGGKLGFLITQSVFKTQGAGDGFRRLRYADGAQTVHLRPIRVDDLSALQVFEGATNRTALCVLEKQNRPFEYPVPYVIWQGRGRIPQDANSTEVSERVTELPVAAAPVNPHLSTSPWLTVPDAAVPGCRKVIGRSAYTAKAGCTTWLNGVYWIRIEGRRADGSLVIENLHDIGKSQVPSHHASIEPDFVFPLLRGEDVTRWSAEPSIQILLPQDPVERKGIAEERLKREARKTYAYLKHFEPRLRKRSGFKKYFHATDPFYSVYNVDQSTFAPHKVAWRDMGDTIQAAVISNAGDRITCPEHHVMFVPCRTAAEAHYLCAILNCAAVRLVVAGYTTNTGISTHVAQLINIPRFDARDETHRRLASLSADCHSAKVRGAVPRLRAIECEIDLVSSGLWTLTDGDLEQIHAGLATLGVSD